MDCFEKARTRSHDLILGPCYASGEREAKKKQPAVLKNDGCRDTQSSYLRIMTCVSILCAKPSRLDFIQKREGLYRMLRTVDSLFPRQIKESIGSKRCGRPWSFPRFIGVESCNTVGPIRNRSCRVRQFWNGEPTFGKSGFGR